MATINVIRSSDGRTLYPCGTTAYPPTNPKMGIKQGNTVTWSERTRITTIIIPRQNPVNIDSWSPKSSIPNTSPVTYPNPSARVAIASPAGGRKAVIINPCPPAPGLISPCGKK